jgi:hypothetical protein
MSREQCAKPVIVHGQAWSVASKARRPEKNEGRLNKIKKQKRRTKKKNLVLERI